MTRTRIANIAISLALLLFFAILFGLTPSQRGLGTHQQIIPIPCTFHYIFKIPCPSCGLTTSMTHIAHGEFSAAFKTHPFGPPLALLLLLVFAASLRGAIKNRAWWAVFEKRWLQNIFICGIFIFFVVWLVKIYLLLS